MKKSVITLLLACCILFPACDTGSTTSSSLDGASISGAFSEIEASSQSQGPEEKPEEKPGDNTNEKPPVEEDCTHKDSDDNGVCDECGDNVELTFDFYAVNDLHGKFMDGDNHPGVDEMTAYLRQAQQQNPNTIFLSSGDMWQGSFESNLTYGALAIDWMNELGFASMTLGNHEYDWGEEKIAANAELAEFPLLAINVYDTRTGKLVDYCQPSVMVERNGAKIGIIGAEGDVKSDIAPDNVAHLEFKTGTELTNLVKAEATRLRAEGADCIIYSLHDGTLKDYDYSTSDKHAHYDEALSQGYVDVVFEAHIHQAYSLVDSYGVYHVQSGGDNRVGLSHAEIQINIANDKAEVKQAKTVEHKTYTSLPGDPLVEELLEKYSEQISPAFEVLGNNAIERESEEIVKICSQLYFEAGAKKWSDKEIILGGGYIGVRSPYKIPTGEVTFGQLLTILPFDNALQLCSVNGSDLQKYFIEKTNYQNYYGEYGASVKENPVANATYYVVIDSYCAATTVDYAKSLKVLDTYAPAVYARDLLAEHIRKGGLDDQTTPKTLSIPEALALGGSLGVDVETTEKYRVEGTIIDIEPIHYSGKHYGNMTIEDKDGNRLYIYGTYDTAGNLYGEMSNPPQVGNVVVLEGKMKNYQGTKVEMIAATVISCK